MDSRSSSLLVPDPHLSGVRSKTFPATLPSKSDSDASLLPSGYRSPSRHHKRAHSLGPREVKETLNASLSYGDDETGQGMRINQYTIKQELGRGSYGAVHVAVDQTGQQFAIKEFSKSRLRKRCQSEILRRPHLARAKLGGVQLNLPSHRRSASQIHQEEENGNALYLIREEIAIMKKLDHQNIVKLYEVLDDPDGDSLYMVMEMCPKGVVMKVNLGETVEPYPEEQCRHWFRDMILGIEFLHSQGIIHRDIKPDNLLLADDDCLKVVDFGVSEMFKKGTGMFTAKSAGSPAFLPPELCRVGHGDISGEAADIWSMGVTLYCLCFGKLPFNHIGVIELYEAIKNDEPAVPTDSLTLKDLFRRILDKNPNTRIKMNELREHPWVTHNGEDMLLSYEENTTDLLSLTEEEVRGAITKSIRHVMTIVKAVNNLKRLTARRRAKKLMFESPHASVPPSPTSFGQPLHRSKSLDGDDRLLLGQHLAAEGIHIRLQAEAAHKDDPLNTGPVAPPRRMDSAVAFEDGDVGIKAQSNPLNDPLPFLDIGVGSDDNSHCIVSESPTGTDENVYEEAYAKAAERIRRAKRVPVPVGRAIHL